MAHTYVSELIHCVFSTKDRRNLISPELQPQLWSFLGGIARKNGFKALMVGGTENHVHILLSLPATMALAKAMQLVKGASSHWMNDKFKTEFAWQRRLHPWNLAKEQHHRLYPGPSGTSSQAQLRRRVSGVLEEEQRGI